MITEERMKILLADAASAFDPPADGAALVIDAIDGPGTAEVVAPRSRRRPVGLALAAAAAAVFVLTAGLAFRDRGNTPAVTTAAEELDRHAASPDAGVLESKALGAQSGEALPDVAAPAAAAGGTITNRAGRVADTAKIVKTGSVDLEVRAGAVGPALDRVTAIVVGVGGYVADTHTGESDGHPSGTITLRIPADHFEAVSAQVRGLGVVKDAESAGKDVSAEFVDNEARLHTLETTRGSLLEVLAKSRAIGDILAVQDRLNAVQTQIEQLQGRQRLLTDQVSMASLSVTLHEPGGGITTSRPSSWHRAVDGFTGAWAALLAHSGTALALVLMLGALAAVLVAGRRYLRRLYARLVA